MGPSWRSTHWESTRSAGPLSPAFHHGRIRIVSELVFLKLGGSLITDKGQRYTVRLKRLAELANEIHTALSESPDLKLILGHGSGSFGHYAVQEHMPQRSAPARYGAALEERAYWAGYAEVWYRASELNRYVMDALHVAGIPSISLAPSATVQASKGRISHWDLTSMRSAIDSGLTPVIFGDIAFDSVTGSSVLSTETLMIHLAPLLQPGRILLAGMEAAVWKDYPTRKEPIQSITPSGYPALGTVLGGSHGTDVTGGMRTKVEDMLALTAALPEVSIRIFSGEIQGNVKAALAGKALGTLISSD
jgi:isopentenyl phosphate kinase